MQMNAMAEWQIAALAPTRPAEIEREGVSPVRTGHLHQTKSPASAPGFLLASRTCISIALFNVGKGKGDIICIEHRLLDRRRITQKLDRRDSRDYSPSNFQVLGMSVLPEEGKTITSKARRSGDGNGFIERKKELYASCG